MDVKFRVTKRILSCTNATYVVGDSVNADRCIFTFDDEWDGLTKSAVFKNSNSDTTYKMLLDSDNSCFIPHEVVDNAVQSSSKLEIMALGINTENSVITKKVTTCMTVPLAIKGVLDSDSANDSVEDTANVEEQILGKFNDYYNKTEIDEKLDGITISGGGSSGGTVNLTNYYNKTQVDSKLADKANVAHTHPASEITGLPTVTDGYSPTATVVQTETGVTISITDKNGTTTATVTNGTAGDKGDSGKSAYALAVEKGYTGSESEWLDSLNGKDGKDMTRSPLVSSVEESLELQPNILYKMGTMANLNITLATPADATVVNEYMLSFNSGATATTFTYPSDIIWSTGTPTIEASKHYEVSILDGYGLIVGF